MQMNAISSSYAMLSHRGKVRRGNEDACGAQPSAGAFVVCDGMGGAAAGEIASHMAVERFLESLASTGSASSGHVLNSAAKEPVAASSAKGESSRIKRVKSARTHLADAPRERLEAAVHAANHTVYQHSKQSRHLRGMGTTLVAALVEESHSAAPPNLWLAHVGDSRCYLLRQGALHLLTEDHSLVEEQIRAGMLSRVQAVSSPIRNIITRAVGSQASVEAEIVSRAVEPGDLYLLASDGLTRELEESEIAAVLSGAIPGGAVSEAALNAACHDLIDAANAAGGGDNITVLLLYFA
jgi:PPM family protein phosphatase